jgi:hypothetical protein
MNLNTLNRFRNDLYQCFSRAGDVLFNLTDALLSESQAHSALKLTLSPFFLRKWPSFYEGLQLGKLDQSRFEQTLARYAPAPAFGQSVVTAVDACNIERPFSETSPDRGWLYLHHLPDCTKPVVAGWPFSTVEVVPPKARNHTYIVSNRRIPTAQTPAQLAIEQLASLRAYFGERPIHLGDRYYPTKDFLVKVSPDYDLLLRPRANRVFYRPVAADPQAKRGRGAPAKHGPRFACNDPATHGSCAQVWVGEDEQGHKLEVSAWHTLHLREAPQLNLSIIRVRRGGARGKKRDPVESWFVWVGQSELELAEVWATYKRRYAIEHGYRFDKQDLLWSQPRLRLPCQFELWTALVSIVHAELHLAAALGMQSRFLCKRF